MTKPVRFDAEAESELAATFCWYEEQRPGLGANLLLAVDAAVTTIVESPAAHGLVPDLPAALAVRRVRVRRFPYSLPFVELKDEIRVLALAHDRRRPRYWHRRRPGT